MTSETMPFTKSEFDFPDTLPAACKTTISSNLGFKTSAETFSIGEISTEQIKAQIRKLRYGPRPKPLILLTGIMILIIAKYMARFLLSQMKASWPVGVGLPHASESRLQKV